MGSPGASRKRRAVEAAAAEPKRARPDRPAAHVRRACMVQARIVCCIVVAGVRSGCLHAERTLSRCNARVQLFWCVQDGGAHAWQTGDPSSSRDADEAPGGGVEPAVPAWNAGADNDVRFFLAADDLLHAFSKRACQRLAAGCVSAN